MIPLWCWMKVQMEGKKRMGGGGVCEGISAQSGERLGI